jgi:lipopolysaccharide export system protein LptA
VIVAALLAALASAAGPTLAVPGKHGLVYVDAAELRYVNPKRQVILTGAPVRMTRDDAVLTCRKLVLTSDEAGRIARAVCSGDVQLVRGTRTITCDTATYEDVAAQVTCVGNPVLRDGATQATGERLVYELSKDEIVLEKPVLTAPAEEVERRQRDLERQRRARKEPGR